MVCLMPSTTTTMYLGVWLKIIESIFRPLITSHFTVLSSYKHFLMVSWIRSSARPDSAVNDADRLPGGWASSAEPQRSGRWVRSDQGTENQKPVIVLAPRFFFWLVILTCGTFSGTLLSKFHVWHNCLILLLSVSLNFCLFPA